MSRVTDIFTRVRDKVGDAAATRWDDAVLIRVMNDGLDDIAIHTKMFRGTALIPLSQGIATYDLPTDLISLKKVLYEGRTLTLRTSFWMEEKVDPDWRSATTPDSLEYAIFDEMDVLRLQVYPRPVNEVLTEFYTFNPTVYGFDDTLFGYTADDYGVIAAIVDSETSDSVVDLFGILSSIEDSKALTVIYNRHTAHVTGALDVPEVPPIYDKMLCYYIAAKLLRQDTDAQNRAYAEEEMNYYYRDLDKATSVSAGNKVTASHHHTLYNGMG